MSSNYRILLVEDDHSTRELLEVILLDEGYTLSCVQNGLEAKNSLQEDSFNLIITDFNMPGLNGVELLKWCRSQKINSSILFMTAASYLNPEENKALIESKAILVQKPLKLETFLKSIKDLSLAD